MYLTVLVGSVGAVNAVITQDVLSIITDKVVSTLGVVARYEYSTDVAVKVSGYVVPPVDDDWTISMV